MYKVWSADRSTKKLIQATTLKDFTKYGKEKLGYGRGHDVTVVVESDGTVVDDEEYFSTIPNMCRLMLLRPGESWSSHISTDRLGEEYDQADGDEAGEEIPADMLPILTMLRHDITKLITLNPAQLQVIVEMTETSLVHVLGMGRQECVQIQARCQRYLDELQDSQEAIELLRYIKDAKLASTHDRDSTKTNPTSPDGTGSVAALQASTDGSRLIEDKQTGSIDFLQASSDLTGSIDSRQVCIDGTGSAGTHQAFIDDKEGTKDTEHSLDHSLVSADSHYSDGQPTSKRSKTS